MGFYNQSRECLLRGMDWIFKSDRYSFVLKGLTVSKQGCSLIFLKKSFKI